MIQYKKYTALIFCFIVIGVLSTIHPLYAASSKDIEIQRPPHTRVRVLLGDALSPTLFTATGRFVVETEEGILQSWKKGTEVSIRYENNEYSVSWNNGKKEKRTALPVTVTPVRRAMLVEIVNFQNQNSWDLNDNQFYHGVQVVYSSPSQKAVLVNDIGIERYTEGLCESGSEESVAYLEAILTAARTYALYHSTTCRKFPGEPYCLDATARSQIYCGAEYSARTPQVVEARRATRKHVITYNDQPIIAAYFHQSDGHTRSWSEVWNGDMPWAQSVEDPCCVGKELQGHGVGMSGEGARYFADQGWGWKKILQYYYTGVTIKPLY